MSVSWFGSEHFQRQLLLAFAGPFDAKTNQGKGQRFELRAECFHHLAGDQGPLGLGDQPDSQVGVVFMDAGRNVFNFGLIQYHLFRPFGQVISDRLHCPGRGLEN